MGCDNCEKGVLCFQRRPPARAAMVKLRRSPNRRTFHGTHLTFLLLRPVEAAILGLRAGWEAFAGAGAWGTRSRAQLGLGGAVAFRVLPRLRARLTRARQ